MTLTTTELAQRSGTAEERIDRLAQLGVLVPIAGRFRPADVQRVRVTEALAGAGISPEDLARLISEDWFSFAAGDALFSDPVPLIDGSLEEVSEDLGIPLSLARRALTAWSVPPPGSGDPVRADDRAILEVVAAVHEVLGGDEDRTVAGIRYFGENLRRIAESQMRWFRSQVMIPALDGGTTQPQLTPMITEIAGRLLPLAERAVAIGYRRHLEHYSVELTVEAIEMAMERAGMRPTRLGDPAVITFLDLTGFTALTEEQGDEAAAEVAERLTEAVRERVAGAGGKTVKFMGDGALLHFHDPESAVRCALDLVDEIPELGLPQAHVGINSGPIVFSDGDYFGRTVNLAARIASLAEPHQVLTADRVLDPVPTDLRLLPLGPVTMKGISEPVDLQIVVRA